MLTDSQIQFLNESCANRWIEKAGNIYVSGDVNVTNTSLTQIPVQYETIFGNFDYRYNLLTTLKGSPNTITGNFICNLNQLTNLIGAPNVCMKGFYCSYNELTSLEGCPRIIKGNLLCTHNPNLNILYGIGRVEGHLYYDNKHDLNEYIIKKAKHNIYLSYSDIAKWIKYNAKYEFLLCVQPEIRQYFSKYIIKTIELNLC